MNEKYWKTEMKMQRIFGFVLGVIVTLVLVGILYLI